MADQLNDLIRCIGFDASTLYPEQRKRLNAFVAGHKPGTLMELHVYPNVDTTAEESVPTGMVAHYTPEATVDAGALSDSLFEHLNVVMLTPSETGPASKFDDEFFSRNARNLPEGVQQFSDAPLEGSMRRVETNKDDRAWEAELGGKNSFVGAYWRYRDDSMRNKDYYLVARSTVPQVVKDYKLAAAQTKPTYQDLVSHPEWIRRTGFGINGAERNTNRLLAAAAETFGVQVLRVNDEFSHLESANHDPVEMAVPDWSQKTHSIRQGTLNGRPAIALSYGVVPANECATGTGGTDDQFYVVANPYDGMYAFPISNIAHLRAAGGLPVDTGRTVPVERIPVDDATPYRGRTDGVVWEGNNNNADMHPDAFRKVDAAFKASMKNMGWNAEHQAGRMIPVGVMISNAQLIRA